MGQWKSHTPCTHLPDLPERSEIGNLKVSSQLRIRQDSLAIETEWTTGLGKKVATEIIALSRTSLSQAVGQCSPSRDAVPVGCAVLYINYRYSGTIVGVTTLADAGT